ncbi:hypothetical protein TVAG_184990 [Trichomonas vaginalis G3]|uniref:Importin N-terminal domain-containing protein n=1 Tax=Trichomonas vaginalis (strain ATCC PRA-98 / G3) TaxID=412133 RepID=A2D8E4_TRIV3|nr:exportin 1/5 family [Trichomonas vaginalis G3]EAY23193.1 hypothetical protein TVAG_184990 [Trichomonas vaginalis G3]KAI5534157.1 exportin 1/5 family [Trichomonas vaginalis G3]|eukprot:XP_001584179.1 hypothetical protein [Trichomonas vaginalis G3]
MDPLVEEVRHLDIMARSAGKNIDIIQSIVNGREDAYDFMVAIFQNAEEDYTLFAGAHLLKEIITKKWDDMNQSQQLDLRYYVLNLLETLPPELNVYQQINADLVLIAIREVPENWPNFLQQILLSEPPKFKLFADFIAAIKDIKITPEHHQQISEMINQNIQEILPIIINHFPRDSSNEALVELAPYLNWEVLMASNIQQIYDPPNPDGFQALTELLLVQGIDEDTLRTFFIALCEATTDNYNYLLPVIQQYLEELENPDSIETLTLVHMKLLVEDIEDFEYWEFFILTIYDDFMNGNPSRFSIHEDVINSLITKLLTTMPKNPEVITFEKRANYSNLKLRYEQTRAMCICIIEMAPAAFVAQITDLFQSQVENFNPSTFSSLCWATSCVAFEEVIDTGFAAEVFKLAFDAVQTTEESTECLACLLYLTQSFINNQKFTGECFDIAAHCAVAALGKSDIENLTVQAIHALAYSMPAISEMIDAEDFFLTDENAIQADNFSVAADAIFHVSSPELKSKLVDTLVGRITNAFDQELSFGSIRELKFCVYALAGTARADPSYAIKVLPNLSQIFTNLNNNFLESIINLIQENSQNAARDDVRLMRSFFCAEMNLYKDTIPQLGTSLLAIFSQLPPNLRMPDALSLAKSIVNVDKSLIVQVRDLVLNIIENLVGEGTLSLEYANTLPELLQTIAEKDINFITSEDITSLEILISKQINKQSLLALTCIINKWSLHPDRQNLMREHIGKIVVCAICAACEPSHRGAFAELSQIASFLIQYSVAQDCPVSLVDGVNNATALGQVVAHEICSRFPCISANDLEGLCSMLIEQASNETFEQVVIQIASKAKMATELETVRHLRVLRVKAMMGMGLFDL